MDARVQGQPDGGAGPLVAFCQAVSEDLMLLASLHDREPEAQYLGGLCELGVRDALALRLRSERGVQSLDLLSRVLADLSGGPDAETLDGLAADYASIYLTHGIQASPLESVWIDEEHLVCQESMFQVRAWYQEHGVGAPDWRSRPDDHLVFQLQFIAQLLLKVESEASLGEVARFMDEHLLRWLMPFAERVAARCSTAYFAGAAMLTAAYSEELRDLLAEILDEPRPSAEEIEERMKPKAPEVEEMPIQFVPGTGPAV